MLYALGQPAAFAGLVAAFVVGVALRAVVQRSFVSRVPAGWSLVAVDRGRLWLPTVRDVDPFGAVAALLGGTGWGRQIVDAEAARPGIGRRWLLVLLAGPGTVLALGVATLVGYRYAFPGSHLMSVTYPSDVLRGVPGPGSEQLLASFGVGLVCFALLAFVPLPPLDGWRLLGVAVSFRGSSAQQVRLWLEERNLGMVALFLLLWLPLGGVPLGHLFLNVLVTPLLRLVA